MEKEGESGKKIASSVLTHTAGAGNKGDSTSEKKSVIPSLSLPKGGGAIRGMGEKFSTNPVTGTGSMSVPVFTTPGRSGFGPQLSLSYDSGAGNGIFGFGWNISLPSITRKTDKGLPRYRDAEESDVFILSGAEDLVPRDTLPDRTLSDCDSYSIRKYRPRTEGLFARIECWTHKTIIGEIFWRSISKDNITTIYGKTTNSRIVDPDGSSRIFSWLISESYDDKGNAIFYEYKNDDSKNFDKQLIHEKNRTDAIRSTNRYLKSIRYGNKIPFIRGEDLSKRTDWMFEVIFDYGEYDTVLPTTLQIHDWKLRLDPFSSYRSGFEVRTYRLCHRILMFHHFPAELKVQDYLVRSMDFTYEEGPVASFITSITQSGYVLKDGTYIKKSLPPLEFEYSKAELHDEIESIDSESLRNLPIGLDGSRYQWVDLDGEGISGILTEQGDAWYYKPNIGGGRLGEMQVVQSRPSTADLAGGRQQLMDLAGDGQLDLVEFSRPVSGFYERTTDGCWDPFRPFTSLPNIPWNNPNLKFVDLNGDGHADVLVTEEESFSWYPSLAESGFSPSEKVYLPTDEEIGPRLVFADGTQSVYLADLSGDGLSDLVRIRNGEICYWPNLGYGKFGAKVAMDNSPFFDTPDLFDQKRIRLVDVDGSGTTDILYLHHDRVDVYFNMSGNGWSDVQSITQFPPIDDLSSVMTADLFGNGTGCLVWSSPLPGMATRQMSFIRLMGEQKPHLLISTINNMGAETRVTYESSTKFYLEDKAAGRPWVTKLPFPVHVVSRVDLYDRISRNLFITQYRYHHGYFDGIEREFRGFGMVEQRDTVEYAALSRSDAFPDIPDISNIDAASHVPPVVTKTWYHTGAFLERDRISLNLVYEYYGAPDPNDTTAFATFLLTLLPDTILPENLSAEEEREVCRSLRGSLLRQEIYAEDGSSKEEYPYSVSERNYSVRCLQPRGDNRHAVFIVHPRETMDSHYERNPDDPRISHAMTFEVDEFGNVLKSAAIGYGRRQVDPDLSREDQAKQSLTLVTYTENHVTNSIDASDDFRTPLACETKTYELTGVAKPNAQKQYYFNNFIDIPDDGPVQLRSDTKTEYEKPAIYRESSNPSGKWERRPIEHVRTLYRRNDLKGLLPLGSVESLALPGDTYKLAFTPGLLSKIYVRYLGPARPAENLLPDRNDILGHKGGYEDLDGTGYWWIPSGRIYYWPEKTNDPVQELSFAKKHFFLPHRFDDPFGNETIVTYDSDETDPKKNYTLVLKKTIDPLGNMVSAVNNYRVLQPSALTDPNGSISEACYDVLGLVVATAINKGDQGDSVKDVQIDLTQDEIDSFFTNPRGMAETRIGSATTYIIYDISRYHGTGDPEKPPYAATIVRETHASDPKPDGGRKFQVSFSYSDGFGREIQKKIQAEPGPVPERGPDGEIIIVDGKIQMTDHDVTPRWVGSGWTIFNNKGKPVWQYEPFFSDTHEFEFAVKAGVSPVLFYDPIGRGVSTLHPNNTYEKVVFDPWRQKTYDVNDTVAMDPRSDTDISGNVSAYFTQIAPVPDTWKTWLFQRDVDPNNPPNDSPSLDPEKKAAVRTLAHTDTPATAYSDTLGRMFLTIADNGTGGRYSTRVAFNIEGNQREVKDAKDRVVMRYDYDMLSNRIRQESMEAGTRWVLHDVTGKPIRIWDSRGFERSMTYDALQRPVELIVTDATGKKFLAEKTRYGESMDKPELTNHRLKPWVIRDGAGCLINEMYDFKGNLESSTRQLLQDYESQVDWTQNPALEAEKFASHTAYDALNRPIRIIAPHSDRDTATVNVIQPAYNEANFLERLDVWLELDSEPETLPDKANHQAITNINYDAKGQRELIEYGNGVKTRYEYDDKTFRLIHLKTVRGTELLQDLFYTYDPAGNITGIRDDARQTVYFNGEVVRPDTEYTYDAIYRLVKAYGREHIGQASQPYTSWDDSPRTGLAHPNDGQKMRNYSELYHYDEVGNFLRFEHRAENGNWIRAFTYDEASLIEPSKKNNRLSYTVVHPDSKQPILEPYTYDPHGNMLSMPHLRQMDWDFKDQLICTDKGTEKIFYVYDAAGQRVRKVAEKNGGTLIEERIYLGTGFEIFRRHTRTDPLIFERETLHVMDDKQRIALIETRTIDKNNSDPAPRQLVRYEFGNHLGSAVLELDDKADVISYEEYYPYGSTSYQAVQSQIETPKRYRYTGKERDEETGLYYHGARYYAPWISKWTSCDPKGLIDTVNLYLFNRANPVNLTDLEGTEPKMVTREYKVPSLLKDIAPQIPDVINKSQMFNILWSRIISERPQLEQQCIPDEMRQATIDEYLGFIETPTEGARERVTTKLLGLSTVVQLVGAEQWVKGWLARRDAEVCFIRAQDAVQSTLKSNEKANAGGILLYSSGGKGKTSINYNPEAVKIGLSVYKTTIDTGRASILGVSFPSSERIVYEKQPVTEHYVTGYGYELSPSGEIVRLFAMDSGVNPAQSITFSINPRGEIKHEPVRKADSNDSTLTTVNIPSELSQINFTSAVPYEGEGRPVNTEGQWLLFKI